MKIEQALDTAIGILGIVAQITSTKFDDKALAGAKAMKQSPAFLAWLQSEVDGLGAAGGTGPFSATQAVPLEGDAAEAMSSKLAGMLPLAVAGEGTPLEIGERIGAFAKWLPVLLAILKQLMDAGILTT